MWQLYSRVKFQLLFWKLISSFCKFWVLSKAGNSLDLIHLRGAARKWVFSSLHFLQETGNKLAVVYIELMLTILTFLKWKKKNEREYYSRRLYTLTELGMEWNHKEDQSDSHHKRNSRNLGGRRDVYQFSHTMNGLATQSDWTEFK